MDTLRRLVGMSEVPPRGVSEDDIYPVHIQDNAKGHRWILSWIMRFNDVLDAKRLHGALSRLLEIGDWRKLGGRLRLKRDGKLEIHVPRPFTAERPAVGFSHNTFFNMSIEDHPAARRFPKATDSPSVQPISIDFQPFLTRLDFPATIQEMIYQGIPQLSLHITSFNDETLVALTWPHTMMDAIGMQALLRSWSLVLAGREEEIPLILGARKDILSEAENLNGEGQQEELMLEHKRLKGVSMAMFMFRYIWDKYWNPARERRMIFLPKNVFVQLRSQAHLEAAEVAQGSNQRHFVSEGDILTAWATRVVASSEPKPQPVTIASLFNTRYRLPLLLESGGIYAQNMVLVTYTFLSSQLVRGTIGQIALTHRQHLVEQTTEQQTLSFLRVLRQDIRARNNARLLFGDPDSLPILFNNLAKVELIKAADFSAAVLRQGEKTESRRNLPGTMITYYNQALNQPGGWANCFYILGKDYGENYWLMGDLLPRAWTNIEEELKKI